MCEIDVSLSQQPRSEGGAPAEDSREGPGAGSLWLPPDPGVAQSRELGGGRQVFNDVSSSYYEGRTFSSMQFNNNRDVKKVKPIGTHGALTDHVGRPIAVDVYSGHTGDPTTVPEQVTKLHESFLTGAGHRSERSRAFGPDPNGYPQAITQAWLDFGVGELTYERS